MPKFLVDPRARTMLGRVFPTRPRFRTRLGDDTSDFYAGATASPIVPAPDFYAGAIASPIVPGTPAFVSAPDLGTPSFGPISFLPSSAPSLPPSFFAPSSPIIPARVAQPAPVAPALGVPQGVPANLTAIPPVQIVFPSQGSVATSRPVATPSWFDQQMVTGVPNSYLLVGAVGIAAFAMLGGRKRKRR